MLGKVQKKYKRAKKALTTTRDFDEPAKQDKIPYPTGETPGRGEFKLSAFLFECSGVGKEDYNGFIVRNFTHLSLLTNISTPIGINP